MRTFRAAGAGMTWDDLDRVAESVDNLDHLGVPVEALGEIDW